MTSCVADGNSAFMDLETTFRRLFAKVKPLQQPLMTGQGESDQPRLPFGAESWRPGGPGSAGIGLSFHLPNATLAFRHQT